MITNYKIEHLVLLVLIFLSTFSSAQEYILQIDHFGIEEGLSHRDVLSVHQDKKGLMWFGTQYGLNRFDGYEFKWYTKETHALQSNRIGKILEDVNRHLWLFDTETHALSQSLDIFDPDTETSKRFEDFFPQRPFPISDVILFTGNAHGKLAFMTRDNELFIYDGQWSRTSLKTENFTEAYELKWGPNDWIWLSSNYLTDSADHSRMLQAFDLSGKQVQLAKHIGFHGLFIRELDDNGNCHYTVTNHHSGRSILYTLSTNGQPELDYSLNNKLLEKYLSEFSFLQGFAHEYLRTESFDLLSFDKELLLFTNKKVIDSKTEPALAKVRAHAHFFQGNSGHIWAINAFGAYQIRVEENKFDRLLYNLPEGAFASRKMCLDDANQLWTIREGLKNLWKVDLKNGAVSTLNQSKKIHDNIPIDYTFNSIIKGQSGLLYFATRNNLTVFNPSTLSYQKFDIEKKGSEVGHNVWALHEDQAGKFWYTTDSGNIGFWDGQKSTWISSLDTVQAPKYCYYFHSDRENNFWLATDRGLFVLDHETGEVKKRYWSKGGGDLHLPFDNIFHLYEEEDGTFWLGTSGTGLIHWNKNQPLPNQRTDDNEEVLYQQFTRAHGLNNVIYAVYEDEHNNFWLPSDNGIIRFNKNTYQTKTYLESDGITHHEFNRISHFQADNGRLFFGGLNGVTTFHPNDFVSDSISTHAPLVVTDFQQFDSDGKRSKEKESQFMKNRHIVLAPDDRFIRLVFSLLTYEGMEKNLYAYKIEGVDNDWNYQKENFIRFSRLPYGKYILRVKGQGVDGQWSENELAIDVVVLKPFYLQTWFLFTTFLSLLAFVFVFYKTRTARLKKQKALLEKEVARQTEEIRQQAEELKSLEKLKSRFFANVSHELRTPLTLMLGPLNSLLKRNYWKEKDLKLLHFINKNSRHLLKLVNEILDLSKLETNSLEVKETVVNFHQYLQPLIAQFNSFGDNEEVKLRFDYQASPDLNILLDMRKFEKIVHNFLSNALKFTPKDGRVDLIVEAENEHLLVKVSDTGPGIHPNDLPHIFDRFYQSKQDDAPTQGGTGIGLSLVAELAELMGGKVWVESELGKGSIFYYQFPMKVVSGIEPKLTTSEKLSALPSLPLSKAAANRQPSTILIVEDNADLRAYIESFLSEDHQIITAENGKVAWDILEGERQMANDAPFTIDLIISDLMMPIMDGFQLLENIKGKDALRHLPVIMLTARTDVRVKLRALRIGVDDYLTKPFVEEELKVRIVNLLRYAQVRKEVFIERKNEPGEVVENEKPIIAEADAQWLEEVENLFAKQISDSQFKIDWVAMNMHLSQRQFTRRLKSLTGLTPNNYLREMRLNIAKDFLFSGKYSTVKETSFAVGFRDTDYFSERFQARFGVRPSEYLI